MRLWTSIRPCSIVRAHRMLARVASRPSCPAGTHTRVYPASAAGTIPAHPEPESAVGAYLAGLHADALRRGYRFDATRIAHPPASWGRREDDPSSAPEAVPRMRVTTGQLIYERDHLRAKLARRSPHLLEDLAQEGVPAPHPLFFAAEGEVEPWERP